MTTGKAATKAALNKCWKGMPVYFRLMDTRSTKSFLAIILTFFWSTVWPIPAAVAAGMGHTVDALKYDKERSTYMLERMQVLYALEQQIREEKLDWEEKTKLRQEKSVPVLLELKQWLTQQLPLVIPKSPLGQAIAYTLPRWEGLSAYALHGQIEIDNNLAENAIRPLAIGRKAFLFAGSHQAAEMTAAMYSFMATCKKKALMSSSGLLMCLKEYNLINTKIFISFSQIIGLNSEIKTVNLSVKTPTRQYGGWPV